jgi:transcriptional regulator with XRE-family HTH domain
MKTLGQRIRELREERALSLREFAKKLGGLSAAFLSDIELGRRYPSDRVLADMANALEIQVKELQAYDTRAPVQDIKRLAESNPAYAVALRKIIDSKVSPEDLMKLAEGKATQKRKK